MATNRKYATGDELEFAVASGVKSGDPVIVGALVGVSLIDRDASGNATVEFEGAYNLSVHAANNAGNVAVAIGDAIFYTDADTPKLSAKNSGYFFGRALGTISSGGTATIPVLLNHRPNVGQSDLGSGVIVNKALGAAAVDAANLNYFKSTEQTGTGSQGTIAHGLGGTPSLQFFYPTNLGAGTAYVITEGTPDGTNLYPTVTTGQKFRAIAIL